MTQWCNIGHQVVGKNVNGQEKKVNRVMYNGMTLLVLIEYLKLQLSTFVVLDFIACW
jgi:hypothetical protein